MAAPGTRAWDLAYFAYSWVPLAAPENRAPMGRPADPAIPHRMTLVRDSYGCSASLWADVIAAIPDRVEAAYLTTKTWAAEDRPGWAQQWEQSPPWRHGFGFLKETCGGYVPTPLGGTPVPDPTGVAQPQAATGTGVLEKLGHEDLAADLAARLSEHQPVLDAGCGSGLMLVPLRGAGLNVVGVDIDLDMVSAALSREPGLRGFIAFADLAALPVRRSGFGSVHAAHIFHLFADARPVLDELLRVTQPGGRLLVNFGAGRQPPPDGIDVAALTRYFTTQFGGDWPTSRPLSSASPGGPPRGIEDFVQFLASRGAVRLEDLEVHSAVERSVNYFISRLEANPFSAPNGVSPAELRSAAVKTRAWAPACFGDPDAPHPARRLTKYLCWETPVTENRHCTGEFR